MLHRKVRYTRGPFRVPSIANTSEIYTEMSHKLTSTENKLSALLQNVQLDASDHATPHTLLYSDASPRYTLEPPTHYPARPAMDPRSWIDVDPEIEVTQDAQEHMRASGVMQADRRRLLEYLHQVVGPYMALDASFLTRTRKPAEILANTATR